MEIFLEPAAWASLAVLVALEVVLGVDNLIFIAILTGKLPKEQQALARRIGIAGALVMRLGLLASIAWIVALTYPVLSLPNWLGLKDPDLSWRDIILIAGGAFLLFKATTEIFHRVEGHEEEKGAGAAVQATFAAVIVQIMLVDLVFSLDSIITAVGMVDSIAIMVTAVLIAVVVMLILANPLSDFVNRHPSVVILALAFLVMIGMTLVAEGFGFHMEKGYVYAAMAFAAGVEVLNLLARRRRNRMRATQA
jgi:predicted tellurium resistance membrane protein TerC